MLDNTNNCVNKEFRFAVDFKLVYGERLEIMFCQKLRNEKKFPNFEMLTEQIKQEINAVKDFLLRMNIKHRS